MSHSAFRLPTPNTVCVRVLLSAHRVHAATRARSWSQSRPASRPPPANGRPGGDSRLEAAPCGGGARAPSSQTERREIFLAQRRIHAGGRGARRRRSLRYTHTVGADKA